ncbi:MAG TPA: integrase [Candidatus Nitrosocosmicus sp.]|nr:integrase [Candidatus Nitrosocosmicus sp.]
MPYQGLVKVVAGSIDWDLYSEYLKRNCNAKTAKVRYNQSIKYNEYLFDESKVKDLLTFSTDKRLHIMKALSSLSKFCGINDEWKRILKKYDLTWNSEVNYNNFDAIDISHMIREIQKLISIQKPLGKSNVILYNVLTGLRPQEAIDSFNLLLSNDKLGQYLSSDDKFLYYYKYPDLFQRRTKKAFISVVNDNILNLVSQSSKITYNSLRLLMKRNEQEFHMAYCRKIFATFLRNEGVEAEIIDLLQGRISKSIFVRHYNRPQLETIYSRVVGKLDKLNQLLTQV